MEEKVLKCSSATDSNKLAGSIHAIHSTNSETKISVRVIGAAALNQATKGIIISNKFCAKKGEHILVCPTFLDTEDDVTSIELRLIFQKI